MSMTDSLILDFTDRLARIEEKLDAALAHGTDHEDRIRTLEAFRNWGTGIASICGAVFGAFKFLGH